MFTQRPTVPFDGDDLRMKTQINDSGDLNMPTMDRVVITTRQNQSISGSMLYICPHLTLHASVSIIV
jgi:hypothetical protein